MALKNLINNTQTVYFSDFDFSFTPHPQTGDIQILKNEESIKRALKTLIQTKFGGRRFYSDKGCNVYYRLFEPLDYITASAIKSDIETAINNYESRVQIIDVIVTENNEYNGYNITVQFSVINQSTIQQVSVFLSRVF